MRIHLISDLHVEFGYQSLPGGDVLIIAGDVCEFRTLNKQLHSTRTTPYTPGKLNAYDFFYHECTKYNKVFYVLGNHEHYHHRFDKTYNDLKAIMPPNITVLENETVEHNGVMFMGATLWTDLNKGDPITTYSVKNSMNDYRTIQHHDLTNDVYRKLLPHDTVQSHKKTKAYFADTLNTNKDKQFVVITHMAPSFNSVHEMYKHETTMNGAYASDLSDLILDNPHIKLWLHGHMHHSVDYTIGDTRVLANPRGYNGHETNNFDPAFAIEL